MTDLPGHVFVIHGNLKDVACDAVLIPTDTSFGVRRHWTDVIDTAPDGKPDGWDENAFVAPPGETTRGQSTVTITRLATSAQS